MRFDEERMDWPMIQDWIFALGDEYGVNPVVFAILYFGAFPFLIISIACAVRNRRRSRPVHVPLLSAAVFSISAYVYVIIAGENIPFWVYGLLVAIAVSGSWKMLHVLTGQSKV